MNKSEKIEELANYLNGIKEAICNDEITSQYKKQVSEFYDIFNSNRNNSNIPIKFYKDLELLWAIKEFEILADKFYEKLNSSLAEDRLDIENKLDSLEEVIGIYIELFSNYASDYPNEVELPNKDDLAFILEIDSDWNFELLLIALSKTRSKIVKKILYEFKNDKEPDVERLANSLLSKYYGQSSIAILKEIKQYIAHDETKEALDKLLMYAENNIGLLNSVILLKSRYKRVEKNFMKGLISQENKDVKLNNINYSILKVLIEV